MRINNRRMINKHHFISIACLLVSIVAFAQQDGNITLYQKHLNIINPALVGVQGETTFISTFRSQWQELQDPPELQAFSFGMPLKNNIGIGLSIVNDKVFIEKQTALNIDVSYQLQLQNELFLYLGIKGGANFYNIDTAKLQNYNADGSSNNSATLEDVSRFNPNIGIGAYLYHKDFYVSLSTPRLLSNERLNEENGVSGVSSERMHLYLSGGYNFAINNDFLLKPSTMLRYVSGAPISTDITVATSYKEKVELGAIFSTDDAYGGFFTFKLTDWMDLGYAYSTSSKVEFSSVAGGIHEFFIKFGFKQKTKTAPKQEEETKE